MNLDRPPCVLSPWRKMAHSPSQASTAVAISHGVAVCACPDTQSTCCMQHTKMPNTRLHKLFQASHTVTHTHSQYPTDERDASCRRMCALPHAQACIRMHCLHITLSCSSHPQLTGPESCTVQPAQQTATGPALPPPLLYPPALRPCCCLQPRMPGTVAAG
jgi:hypothetical protein